VPTPHHYIVYGLKVASDILVPDVPTSTFEGEPDVTVQLEADLEEPVSERLSIEVEEDVITLSWAMLGTYRIIGDDIILVHPRDDEAHDKLHLPLFGIVFGVLLHLRGYLTLHASAVSIDGNVVGFMGQKGQGKSTTALALRQAGAGFVADDVIAALPEGDRLRVFCGPPSAKAWPASLEAIGGDPDAHERLHPEVEKRMLSVETVDASEPMYLHSLYVLHRSEETSFVRLSGTEALVPVLSNAYAQRFLGKHGATDTHLRLSSLAVSSGAVYRLKAKHGLDEISQLAADIISHVKNVELAA
jgi:hypothetical protein